MLRLGLAGAAAALVDALGARRARARGAVTDPRERRLANLRQLTFGGQNAEAYFDWTGRRLVFQSTRPPFGCDQIFTMAVDGSEVRLVSTGKGRTTCGFFFPDGRRLIDASTHPAGPGARTASSSPRTSAIPLAAPSPSTSSTSTARGSSA